MGTDQFYLTIDPTQEAEVVVDQLDMTQLKPKYVAPEPEADESDDSDAVLSAGEDEVEVIEAPVGSKRKAPETVPENAPDAAPAEKKAKV